MYRAASRKVVIAKHKVAALQELKFHYDQIQLTIKISEKTEQRRFGVILAPLSS